MTIREHLVYVHAKAKETIKQATHMIRSHYGSREVLTYIASRQPPQPSTEQKERQG